MNLPYFYEEAITLPLYNLSEDTSKHCVQVLRMKEREQLQLTDGKGHLYTATIIGANKKSCVVQIDDTAENKQQTQPTNNKVSIAISLLKNPSRLEWFMEKATEIGVSAIVPLICDHTEKQNFRIDRMQNILISAMLQSKQTWLPQLHQPKKFSDFISDDFDGVKLIAHCVEDEKRSIQEINQSSNHRLILIGPEGDFSKEEIDAALAKNFIPVTLGNTRLRTETAGMVAATLLVNL